MSEDYIANKSDVVASATDMLVFLLGAGDREFANKQFSFIRDYLNANGNPGKQVRYVRKSLHNYANESNGYVKALALDYASSLPQPVEVRDLRRNSTSARNLEAIAEFASL